MSRPDWSRAQDGATHYDPIHDNYLLEGGEA